MLIPKELADIGRSLGSTESEVAVSDPKENKVRDLGALCSRSLG